MTVSRTQPELWRYVGAGALGTAVVMTLMLPIILSFWRPFQSTAPASPQATQSLENQALGYQMVLGKEPDNVNECTKHIRL